MYVFLQNMMVITRGVVNLHHWWGGGMLSPKNYEHCHTITYVNWCIVYINTWITGFI
uniref:Uncharacterized protein n=1 Tax=Lepeophtheirus salmonis TaxID=72036 RepID=A0A0K2V556_LEPSM